MQQTRNGMSARTRNSYLASALAFCNWCADEEVGRLLVNPFDNIEKANEKADKRRQRRAMTEEELVKLLKVARERPLCFASVGILSCRLDSFYKLTIAVPLRGA